MESLFEGPLATLVGVLSEPRPLSRCVGCEPSVISLDWSLTASVPERSASGPVSFGFEFAATRCTPGRSEGAEEPLDAGDSTPPADGRANGTASNGTAAPPAGGTGSTAFGGR